MCPDALYQVQECVQAGKPLMDYVPDFTCKVVEDARILRIKLSDFKACIQGKFEDYRTERTRMPSISHIDRSDQMDPPGSTFPPDRGSSEPARVWASTSSIVEDAKTASIHHDHVRNDEIEIAVSDEMGSHESAALRYKRSNTTK